MGTVVAAGAVVALFAVVLGGLAWMAARVRRRGGGESLLQPFDEIWHPTAYSARLEVEAQEEVPAPSPSPGDRLIQVCPGASGSGRPRHIRRRR